MPAFAFLAVDPNGRRIRGIEEAASDAALAHGLEARGLLVVEVAERADAEQRSGFRGGQRQAVLEVTRAVAALLTAGLPLARSGLPPTSPRAMPPPPPKPSGAESSAANRSPPPSAPIPPSSLLYMSDWCAL